MAFQQVMLYLTIQARIKIVKLMINQFKFMELENFNLKLFIILIFKDFFQTVNK